MRKHILLGGFAVMLFVVTGCSSLYTHNVSSKEPHAILKMKLDYPGVKAVGMGAETNKNPVNILTISEDDGTEKLAYYENGYERRLYPKAEAFLLRPGKSTDVRVTIVDYREELVMLRAVTLVISCPVQFQFTPEKNKIYYIEYVAISLADVDEKKRTCSANLYEQIPQAGGGFKLKAVGKKIKPEESNFY